MMAEVYGGLAGLKVAFDLVKGLKDINDATIRNATLMELQGRILEAQQEQSTLLQHLTELKDELKGLRDWEAEKQRYQLKELPPGILVYALKEQFMAEEPSHSLCPTCYQKGKKSLLHSNEPGNGIHRLTCYECKTQLRVGHFRPLAPLRSSYWDE